MGDPRKLHKKYRRPKQLFSKTRIEEEKAIMKKYGLKNMREIWKAETEIDRIRNQAKKLILQPELQETFFKRLRKLGLIKEKDSLDDVLALTKEKLLERRLQTIVFKKNLAKTPKEARQLITHKKIKIKDKIVNIPSYIVKTDEENKISLVQKTKQTKELEKPESEPQKQAKEGVETIA